MKTEKIEDRFGLVQTGFLTIKSLDRVLKSLSFYSKGSCSFQLVSSVPIVSEKQAWVALLHSLQAFKSGTGISNKQEFELLLHLSGKRQIKEALELLSLKDAGTQCAVLFGWGKNKKTLKEKAQNLGHLLGFVQKNGLLEKNFSKNKKQILKAFDISRKQIFSFKNWKERDAIEALVIEKMALLGLE